MSKPSTAFTLSPRTKRIICSLKEALIDETKDLVISNCDEELIRRRQILVREFPKTFRWGFILGMYVFDRITFLFGFGLRRFVNLKPEGKKKYVQKWLGSRSHFVRNMVAGLRGIVMVSYFSHKDVWNYIGYDPVGHSKQKIELRERLVREGKYLE